MSEINTERPTFSREFQLGVIDPAIPGLNPDRAEIAARGWGGSGKPQKTQVGAEGRPRRRLKPRAICAVLHFLWLQIFKAQVPSQDGPRRVKSQQTCCSSGGLGRSSHCMACSCGSPSSSQRQETMALVSYWPSKASARTM